jgi:hypothetical protein
MAIIVIRTATHISRNDNDLDTLRNSLSLFLFSPILDHLLSLSSHCRSLSFDVRLVLPVTWSG